jgi:hypothetical protein
MTLTTTTKVHGVREAIVALRRIDPELRKQFNRDVKAIAKPVVDAAKGDYPAMPLSGMTRAWSQRGRELFPWSNTEVRKGVKVKIDTNRKAVATIKIQQTNPAAAIYELAGKQANNLKGQAFINNLEARFGRAQRVLWPAFERNSQAVISEMTHTVEATAKQVTRMLL